MFIKVRWHLCENRMSKELNSSQEISFGKTSAKWVPAWNCGSAAYMNLYTYILEEKPNKLEISFTSRNVSC